MRRPLIRNQLVAKPESFPGVRREGGGVLPYISHIGMCRPKGYGFWGLLGLKTDIHFAHLGLDSSMVFEGTTGAYERIYRYSDSN